MHSFFATFCRSFAYIRVSCHFMKLQPENIHIDEAGNTGQDLLNKDQKVFVLASNNFSATEFEALISLFENKTELHFKDLKNSDKGRQSIIQFLNHPLITERNIICVAIHKEFATVGQIVDQIIEPVLFEEGIDIYKYGENISLTNFIIDFGNFFWDKLKYENLLSSFITMVRIKTNESIADFYKNAKLLFSSLKSKEKDLIAPILDSKKQIETILEGIDKFTIDVTLSSFYVLCDLWHKKSGRMLNIYQDNSKQIAYYKEYIEFTKSLNISKQEIGYGSRKVVFPTQIEKMELVNSDSHLGVQVSDLIASSLGFMYSNKNEKHKEFVKQIQNSKLLQLSNYHTAWHSAEVTPKDLDMETGDGQNILDFLALQRIKNGS